MVIQHKRIRALCYSYTHTDATGLISHSREPKKYVIITVAKIIIELWGWMVFVDFRGGWEGWAEKKERSVEPIWGVQQIVQTHKWGVVYCMHILYN